ncbi:hypothetical protein E2C01_096594 [Portunus trituberculatus]|uniref:Uncharacterized protein n=1 Tax=Portunus trituberculatus TaxID=210409 RepID=A0A5B7JSY6_PORTR|nr:hypothetical protein [Portunus trituberculatus]
MSVKLYTHVEIPGKGEAGIGLESGGSLDRPWEASMVTARLSDTRIFRRLDAELMKRKPTKHYRWKNKQDIDSHEVRIRSHYSALVHTDTITS